MSESSRISYNTLTYSTPMPSTSLGYFSEEQLFIEIVQNSFFPLFTEISRFCHLPHFIDCIQLLLMLIQEIGVSIWCGSLLICQQKNSGFDILFMFTDWGIIRTPEINDCVIQYLIGFGLFLFSNLFLLFIILLYQRTHNFNKVNLYILHFLFFSLLSYLVPIYGSFVGRSFTEIISKNPTPISVTFFIFSVIIYIISIHEIYFINKFSTDTTVIDQSLIGTWDDQLIFLTILSISLASMLQIILDVFPKWLHVCALVGYVLAITYRIYLLYFAPMLRYLMNSLFLSVCFMSILNCVFSIVHIYVSKIPSWVYIFVSFVSFFIILVFVFFFYRIKKLKYLRKINYTWYPDNENPNETEKREHFDKLVFSSARDAISFMHIGVMFQADSIIDFFFLRYLMENYAEPSIIIAVSKVASFFPSETIFLGFCLSEVEKICQKRISENYLIYQMRLILVIRQSSVSVEATNQLGILQKMSRETISQVRGFWAEILNAKTDVSFASLQYLRKLTIQTDSAFLNACDRFPNNVSIMNEYCRFQIEGMANFSGAISSNKRMYLLNQGKNLTIDYAFKALVNVYHDYLLKNIFDIHGNLLGNGIVRDQSSFSISTTISSQEDFEGKYEEIISQLYLHGKLRIALQLRMKSTKLWPFQHASLLSIIQLLFCVTVYIVIIFLFPISSNKSLDVIECCNEYSKVSLRLQYISCIVGIRSAIKKRAFSGVNMLRSQLGISSNDLKAEPSFFQNPEKAIFNSTRKLREQFDKSMQILTDTNTNGVHYTSSFTEESTQYTKGNDLYQYLSVQSSIAQYCYTAEVLSTIISTSLSSNIDQLSEELLKNTNEITGSLEQLQVLLNNKGIESIISLNNSIKYITIVVISIGCFLLLCWRIFNFVSIFNQTKQLSNMLRKIDPELIKESFHPIALRNDTEVIGATNPHSAHEYDILLLLHPLLIVISIITIVCLSMISIVYFFDNLEITDSVFQWFLHGNIRFSSILGSLVVLCAGSTNAIDHDTEYSILTSKMNNLFLSQKYIDLTLMRIDPQINRLYFAKQCENETSTNSYKDYAGCLSLSSKIYVATSAIQNLVDDNAPMILNNQDFASLIYLVDTFLYEEFERFQQLIVQYSFHHFDTSEGKMIAMCVSGLVFSALVFIIEQCVFLVKFKQSLDAIKQLVLMLPPVAVATSAVLMDFINNDEKNEDSEVNLTAAESIISTTSTAAIMLNKEKTIQAVNKAVNTTTGFLPDQILGQKVKWLIPPPSIEYNQKVSEVNKRFYAALNSFTDKKSGKSVYRPNNLSNEDDSLLFEIHNEEEDDMAFNSTMTVTTAPTVITPVSTSRQIANDTNDTTFSMKKNGYQRIPDNDNRFDTDTASNDVIVLTAMCLTESGAIITARTTIVHLRDRLTAGDQYVILLRDVSKEAEALRAAQESRMKTARLLAALIPPDLAAGVLESHGGARGDAKPSEAEGGRRSGSGEEGAKGGSAKEEHEVSSAKEGAKGEGEGSSAKEKHEVKGAKEGAKGEGEGSSAKEKHEVKGAKEGAKGEGEGGDQKSGGGEPAGTDGGENGEQVGKDEAKDACEATRSDGRSRDASEAAREEEAANPLEACDVQQCGVDDVEGEGGAESPRGPREGSESEGGSAIDPGSARDESGAASAGSASGSCIPLSDLGGLGGHFPPRADSSDEYESVKIENDYSGAASDDRAASANEDEDEKSHGKDCGSKDDERKDSSTNEKGGNDDHRNSSNNESRGSKDDEHKSSSANTTNEKGGGKGDTKNGGSNDDESRGSKEDERKSSSANTTNEKGGGRSDTKNGGGNEASRAANGNDDGARSLQQDSTNYSLNYTKYKSQAFTSLITDNFITSPHATVVAIRLAGLNELAHILAPSHLLAVFRAFADELDKAARSHPLVSVVGASADQLLACSGVFAGRDDARAQAAQCASFALTFAERVLSLNEQLDVDVGVRVGVSSGGPVIGSVLAPDVPSFELFGHFIELAKRMQNEGEVGVVRVSEKVADLLDREAFAVEKGREMSEESGFGGLAVFNVKMKVKKLG